METFEELEIVVNGLIAYGNDVEPVLVPKYESEYVDYKYCIIVSTDSAEKLKNGNEWYERNFTSTSITSRQRLHKQLQTKTIIVNSRYAVSL